MRLFSAARCPLIKRSCLLVLTTLCVSNVWAHHNSSGIFDFQSTITVHGELTRIEWANPHVYFFVKSRNAEGEQQDWSIQAGGIGTMSRMGWTKDRFKIGDVLALTGNPGIRDKNELLLVNATSADVVIPIRLQDPGQQRIKDAVANSLAGTWWTLLDLPQSMEAFYPDQAKISKRGHAGIASFDDETEFPGLECVPFIAPFSMIIADLKVIHIEADVVRIISEYDNAERVIYLTEKTQEAPAEPSLHGFSIGTLSDGRLDVVTTNYLEHRVGNGWALASSNQRRLEERFELAPDGQHLTYSYTLSDPIYLNAPLTSAWEWVPRNDLKFEAGECDLGNARRYLEGAE
ncbi:MAG: DUF6152 family protein [Pseudomonadota bacterium]